MRRFRPRLGSLASVAFSISLLALSSAAPAAGDYSDESFSVRLPPAFLRFTEVSAFGGETVANRFSSAINPAAVDWIKIPNKYGVVLAPYYSNVCFDSGNKVRISGESVTYDIGSWGTIQPTISQVRSNNHKDRLGLTFDYEVDSIQVQWGKSFGDWAAGVNVNFNKAQIARDTSALRIASSNAENYRFRFGGLYEPVKKLLLGMIFEYGWSPFRSKALNFATFQYDKWNGVAHQFILRPGVSYEYAELCTVFVDYQWGAYINTRDQMNDHRFSAGVEHRVLKWLFLRATGSFDIQGNLGGGVGASVFLSEHCSLDLGYQYNMLPELRPEFGRAHTLQATFSVRF